MALWTTADRDRLKAAILALACGEQAQTIRYDGPPGRTVVYHPTDLTKMRDLLAEMNAVLGDADGTRRRVRYMGTRNGFKP